jgi:hypothetical protein
MVGTPAYMSPEQMSQGKDADVRSDIYSLGMTFFTVLVGAPAYKGDTTISIMQQRMTHDIPYKKLTQAGVPEGLVTIIRYMTVKDRPFRYQTPEDLLQDLVAVERGETPVHAKKLPATRTATQRITQKFTSMPPPPPPPPEPSRKRQWAFAIALGILALAVVAMSLMQYLRSDVADASTGSIVNNGKKPLSEDEAAFRKAADYEAAHPDRIEDALREYQAARAKVKAAAWASKLDEKITACRERLRQAMNESENRLREIISKHLDEKRVLEAQKAVDDAAASFACDEWKQVCRALSALILSRSQ